MLVAHEIRSRAAQLRVVFKRRCEATSSPRSTSEIASAISETSPPETQSKDDQPDPMGTMASCQTDAGLAISRAAAERGRAGPGAALVGRQTRAEWAIVDKPRGATRHGLHVRSGCRCSVLFVGQTYGNSCINLRTSASFALVVASASSRRLSSGTISISAIGPSPTSHRASVWSSRMVSRSSSVNSYRV